MPAWPPPTGLTRSAETRDVDLFLRPGTAVPGTPPAVCTGTESAGPQQGLTANDQDIFVATMAIPTPWIERDAVRPSAAGWPAARWC